MRILAVSVHPDDETLGCGGTLLKHRFSGDETFWLILTDALTSEGYSPEFVDNREAQISEVAAAYRFTKHFQLKFPTTQLHSVDFNSLIQGISSVMEEVKPEVVYTINRSDAHTDHQVGFTAVMSSTKSFRCPYIKRLLMYECVSETEAAPPLPENAFIPNVYSDITQHLQQKIEIMGIYNSEVQDPPLPRSIENIKALARYRGSAASFEYAESFMLLRDRF